MSSKNPLNYITEQAAQGTWVGHVPAPLQQVLGFDCNQSCVFQFACKTPSHSPQCVSRMSVCDGRDDCDDGSDESPCKKFQTAIEMRLMGEEANMTAFYTTIPLAETSTISSN